MNGNAKNLNCNTSERNGKLQCKQSNKQKPKINACFMELIKIVSLIKAKRKNWNRFIWGLNG